VIRRCGTYKTGAVTPAFYVVDQSKNSSPGHLQDGGSLAPLRVGLDVGIR